MGTSNFDGDGNLEKYYCLVRFTKELVTDVWDISRRRKDLEDTDCSFMGLASEFKVLMNYP